MNENELSEKELNDFVGSLIPQPEIVGRGEIRGPNGELKSTFTIGVVTPELKGEESNGDTLNGRT